MILIPAIDILGGKCVRLLQGDYNKATEYSQDPAAVADRWRTGGAERIHVVDLDGAKAGEPVNEDRVIRIAQAGPVPVQIGGGIRTFDQVQRYLESGIDRIILGTSVLRTPDLLTESAQAYPGQVWVGIDGREGKAAVDGWTENTDVDVYDLAEASAQRGASGIIFTDISRDGTLTGPNLASLERMAGATTLPIIASGGISTLEDLRALSQLGIPQIEGCIVGKALYSEAFSLEEGISALTGRRVC